MIETCRRCGVSYEHLAKRSWKICNSCNREYMREAGRRHRESPVYAQNVAKLKADPRWVDKERARGRKYWNDLRHEAILRYGGYRCRCCGESEPKFLTLDHVNNDGSAHRKEIRNRGSGIFKWLKDHDYPSGFQVLCMNCNHGKALNGGVCPHQDRAMKTA